MNQRSVCYESQRNGMNHLNHVVCYVRKIEAKKDVFISFHSLLHTREKVRHSNLDVPAQTL